MQSELIDLVELAVSCAVYEQRSHSVNQLNRMFNRLTTAKERIEILKDQDLFGTTNPDDVFMEIIIELVSFTSRRIISRLAEEMHSTGDEYEDIKNALSSLINGNIEDAQVSLDNISDFDISVYDLLHELKDTAVTLFIEKIGPMIDRSRRQNKKRDLNRSSDIINDVSRFFQVMIDVSIKAKGSLSDVDRNDRFDVVDLWTNIPEETREIILRSLNPRLNDKYIKDAILSKSTATNLDRALGISFSLIRLVNEKLIDLGVIDSTKSRTMIDSDSEMLIDDVIRGDTKNDKRLSDVDVDGIKRDTAADSFIEIMSKITPVIEDDAKRYHPTRDEMKTADLWRRYKEKK